MKKSGFTFIIVLLGLTLLFSLLFAPYQQLALGIVTAILGYLLGIGQNPKLKYAKQHLHHTPSEREKMQATPRIEQSFRQADSIWIEVKK